MTIICVDVLAECKEAYDFIRDDQTSNIHEESIIAAGTISNSVECNMLLKHE